MVRATLRPKQSWIRGSNLLGQVTGQRGWKRLRKSAVSVFCADPDRVANLEQVSVLIEEAIVTGTAGLRPMPSARAEGRQAADAERTSATATTARRASVDGSAVKAAIEHDIQASVEGAPQCRLSFEFSNGQVTGQITGTYEGDQINLAFQGTANGNQFSVPLSGYLIDSSWPFRARFDHGDG